MEFSLGGNGLENYINTAPKTSHSNSDSLRAITDLTRLELYFRDKKDTNSKIIDHLWRRIEECEAACMQLSDSVDMSYSRINEDVKALNIERYQDLLPYTFKEVEWARSSRIDALPHSDRLKVADKFDSDITVFEGNFQAIRESQAKMIEEVESSFFGELKEYSQLMEIKHLKSLEILKGIETRLVETEQDIALEQQLLESDLSKLYGQLVRQIDDRINQIEEEVIELSH